MIPREDGFQIVAPEPSGTITSLRSLGYTIEAAVADLIDNSIAAGAVSVWVDVDWNHGDPWLAIVDDGSGMSEPELLTAMRIAGRGPDSSRRPTDLGRFGLGLKTASFSHARQLVVASRRADAPTVTRAWDLDLVRATGEWRLLTAPPPDSIATLDRAAARMRGHGTAVLWRRIDRTTAPEAHAAPSVADEGPDVNDQAEADFHNRLADLEPHLAMVFHRYLTRRLRIYLNDHEISPWDPFQTQYPQTRSLPIEYLGNPDSPITVTGHILPHRRYLTDEQHESAGGLGGWLEQQGFYVYRRDRLIVTGGWLGLPQLRVEERYALARIAVEIPTQLDHEWSLDVRKSMALPPVSLHRPLLRLARRCREEAVKVQIRRVRLSTSRSARDQLGQPWRVQINRDAVTCTLDRDHPLIKRVLTATTDSAAVQALLRLLENTIPLAALRVAHEPDTPDPGPFEQADPTVAEQVAEQLYAAMLNQGRSPAQARALLRKVEWLQASEGFWTIDAD